MESSSEFPSSDLISQNQNLEHSTEFRFPAPTVDTRISTWVETQSNNKMSTLSEAPSDESHLSESTYEFIDTDVDSHDENATESLASVEYGRLDDMASLADSDNSDESEGEHTQESSIPGYGLDNSINNSFNNPTIGPSSTVLPEAPDTPLSQSIEFEEPFGSLGAENVSVKHTVKEFTKEESEASARNMNLPNPPSHLILTIRQTMSKQGLLTKDPLRILYVGSHSAKQDIIHKIASSVAASVEGQERSSRSSSQIYNVVPVSAFGSEKTPEVELMHSSGYQIKVDDCLSAQVFKFEDIPGKPDIIKLNLEEPSTYHSVPEDDPSRRFRYHFIIEPEWELPHVAVFYCSESDDVQARCTRTLARKFMNRHSIPSIVISHKQLTGRAHGMSLDQRSIHMCLEPRETNGKGNIVLKRLPIDLASFLNIDARQMNRNIAYLTGLYEHTSPTSQTVTKKLDHFVIESTTEKEVEKMSAGDLKEMLTNVLRKVNSLLPLVGIALIIWSAMSLGISDYHQRFNGPSISINSKAMSAVPMMTASITGAASSASAISAIPATSTSTQAGAPSTVHSSPPNWSLSRPQLDFEKLTETTRKTSKSDMKCDACRAEILGDREILIRIPPGLTVRWLFKKAMSVNITRNNISVDTERAYTSEDGIILLIPKKEAYGVLNISVVTTKKPLINETFQVDFGTNPLQTVNTVSKFYTLFKEDTEKILKDIHKFSDSKFASKNFMKSLAFEDVAFAATQLAHSAKSMLSSGAAEQGARISHELSSRLAGFERILADHLLSLQNIGRPIDERILKAQIRSKALWLKMQGKSTEAKDYERRAALAMSEAAEARKSEEEVSKKTIQAKIGETRQAAIEAKKEAMAAAKRVGWTGFYGV